MTTILDNVALGLSTTLQPINLLFALLGALIGTAIGVLPGLGPLATLSLLLPITLYLEPATALIMLAGIYYGSQYGGSTTAILINLPGESSSAVTCIDGHQLAKQGNARAALSVAALGSFFAGTVATLLIAVFAVPFAQLGLMFRSPDYFSFMVFGLIGAVVLAQGSMLKALGMIVLGILLGLVGTDTNSGTLRFTIGIVNLESGIDFALVAMGAFGLGEIIFNLSQRTDKGSISPLKIEGKWLSARQFNWAWPAALRGTALGSTLGLLPGGGALLSSFASYALEKKISRAPERFGKGAIEGVAGPESANNAGAQTSFIPMLTLGIPSNAVMAVLMGAMTMHGVMPGPGIFEKYPALVWGLICSMWVGNLMLLIINLPLVGIWARVIMTPYRLLFPIIVAVCCIGAYSVNSDTFGVYVAAFFGIFGYLCARLGCELAPFSLAFILGPLIEEQFRRAMLLSHGDPAIFLERPISASFLIASVLLLGLTLMPQINSKREVVFKE